MAKVAIHFYGRLAEQLGPSRSIELAENGCTIAELRQLIGDVAARSGVKAAVRDQIVGDDFRIGGGDEVDFFPPLSGG